MSREPLTPEVVKQATAPLSQEARYIIVNRASVNELRKLLRELAKREVGE